jgi:hypothetical protein
MIIRLPAQSTARAIQRERGDEVLWGGMSVSRFVDTGETLADSFVVDYLDPT